MKGEVVGANRYIGKATENGSKVDVIIRKRAF